MKQRLQQFLLLVLALGVLVGIVSCHVSIWNECREDHSWLYCMHTVSGGGRR